MLKTEKVTVLVPTDVKLAERNLAIGKRRLSILERLGLMTTLPIYHRRYTRPDRKDFENCLRTKLDPNSQDETNLVLLARQESIRKQVVAHNGCWVGASIGAGAALYSFRHYNIEARSLIFPFLAYGGAWVGRWVANGLTGRWTEYKRDKMLAKLPTKKYLTESEI